MNTDIILEKTELPNPIESYTLIWSDIALVIKWKPYCHGDLIAHLEITSENRMALPITETGYKSYFVDRAEVMELGGPVAYVQEWLHQEAGTQPQQASLF